MKIIVSESQKNKIIKKLLSEDETSTDGGITVGDVMKKAIEIAKSKKSSIGSSSTGGSSSVGNVQGSGNLGNVKLLGGFDGTAKNNISLLNDAMN